MRSQEHTTVWGIDLGISRSSDPKGWYKQLKEWWAAYKATRHEAQVAALTARWDAKGETVRPLRADAAADMLPQAYAHSSLIAFCALGV